MIVIGLILILAAAGVTAAALLGQGPDTSIELFDYQVVGSPAMFFVIGLGVMLAFAVGVWMFAAGTGRSARRHRELKRLRRQAEAEPAPAPAPASEPVTETTTEPTTEATTPTVPTQSTSEPTGAHRDSETRTTS